MSYNREQILRMAKKIENVKNFKGLEDNPLYTKEYAKKNEADISTSAVVDVESTGLNKLLDEVVEVAARKFLYNKKENVYLKPLDAFNQFSEPSAKHRHKFAYDETETKEMSSEEIYEKFPITYLTGIYWKDLEGQSIDYAELRRFLEPADSLIAHNMDYDAKMLSKYIDLKDKPFYCTSRGINWYDRGYPNGKQEILTIDVADFSYSAHRAITDVDALLHLIFKADLLKELFDEDIELQIRGFVSKEFFSYFLADKRCRFMNRAVLDSNKKPVYENGKQKRDKYSVKNIKKSKVKAFIDEVLAVANEINSKHDLTFTEVKDQYNYDKRFYDRVHI